MKRNSYSKSDGVMLHEVFEHFNCAVMAGKARKLDNVQIHVKQVYTCRHTVPHSSRPCHGCEHR